MSGAEIDAIVALAAKLKRTAQVASQRRVLLLSGAVDWCRSVAQIALPDPDTLWISDAAPAGNRCLPVSKARLLLGRDVADLVIDAHSGFDPDAFGAASGSLCGGGLLVLLTPPLAEWPATPDPQNTRIAVLPYAPEQLTGRFLQRLVRIFTSSDDLVRVAQGKPLPSVPALTSTVPVAPPAGPYGSVEQQQAVAAIRHMAGGHRHRPLVISADRGRGKSSALGLAAAQLLLEAPHTLLVTAPRAAAVDTLFAQARRHLPGAQQTPGRLCWNGGELRFVAPDALIHAHPDADLLLVDEAAGIPLPMLEALLQAYTRTVFASTVHGYEGSGRGFTLKFRAVLERCTPGWRSLDMDTPIRWAPGDPLERLVYHSLLLQADSGAETAVSAVNMATCRFARLDRDALVRDEGALAQWFGLLVQAHYRTRPFDLRHLLDGPNLELYALYHGTTLVAAAVLAREGELDETLAQSVFAGERRVQGHLLPQSLVANLGIIAAAGLRYGRIMRIAVHPALQGQGLGSQLLSHIEVAAQAAGLDWLGTSFGMSAGLVDFWKSNEYQPVRLGMRREASSGSYSVLMLKPLCVAAAAMMAQARQRFQRQFQYQLVDSHRELDADLVARLQVADTPVVSATLEESDWREIHAFAYAHRGYEDSALAIGKLVQLHLSSPDRELSGTQHEVLVRRVLQHQPWGALVATMGLEGKASALALARDAVAILLRRLA